MPSVPDHGSVLDRIAALATEAAKRSDLPDGLDATLAEIASLAKGTRTGDTPEPSDVPHTENQSL